MKENNINLELRKEILERALVLESEINQLLLIFLSINKDNSKTLSNRSSSLSFKNKIDLLYDLENINKQEHETLILFMEIRNKFIHNIKCSTFTKVLKVLGNDKRNRLLKYDKKRNKNFVFMIYL
jgi:predicted nucleic acid-binding Zn ribbon protein